MRLRPALLGLVLFVPLMACGDSSLGALGDECVATSDCEEGLTCDLGQSPSVCADMQTPRPDAGIDAMVIRIDADPNAPDARPMIDSAPGTPDAMVDAAVPDAMVDAAMIDANTIDAM